MTFQLVPKKNMSTAIREVSKVAFGRNYVPETTINI